MINYKNEIEFTRENYLLLGRSNKDKLKKIPIWVRYDKMYCIYIDAPRLFAEGKIVYGCLLQANSNIFAKRPKGSYPGVILYSMDSYYDENPLELHELATMIFSYKNKKDVPESIKDIVACVTSEMDSPLNMVLPLSLTENRLVYFTCVMFHRNHLPSGKLDYGIFPVLALPDKLKSTIVLPGHYWSEKLK